MKRHKIGSVPPQIGNVKAETEITWSKDCIEIAEDDEDAQKIERKEGELTFNIGKVSPLDGGRALSGVVSLWVESQKAASATIVDIESMLRYQPSLSDTQNHKWWKTSKNIHVVCWSQHFAMLY